MAIVLSFLPRSLVGLVTGYFASITVLRVLQKTKEVATCTHATNKVQEQAAAKMGNPLS